MQPDFKTLKPVGTQPDFSTLKPVNSNYQPKNDEERNYLAEAGKLYDTFWAKPSLKVAEAGGKFVMDIAETIASPLTNLAIGLYANSKGARMQAKQDKEWATITENIINRINDPETSLENKKRLAHTLNTTFPPNMITNAIAGDLTPKKALYDTASSIFETALVGATGGTGMSARGFFPVIKESLKQGLKFGTLQAGKSTAEGMKENKPLEEIIGESVKEGGMTSLFVAGVEASIPFTRAVGGLLGRGFNYTTNKVAGWSGRAGSKMADDVIKVENDIKTLVSEVERQSPKSEVVGGEILDTLSLQQRAAREESIKNVKTIANSIEQEYIHPSISSKDIGLKTQAEIENWVQGEKDIAHGIFEAKDFSTNRARPSNYVEALSNVQRKTKNVGFIDSLKSQVGKNLDLATEIDPRAKEIIDGMVGYDQKLVDQALKKAGVSAELQPVNLTIQELIDTKQAIDEIVFKGAGDIKPKDTRLIELSLGLKKDIESALNALDPKRAKQYADELTRYGQFKESWSQLKSASMAEDPMEALFSMSQKDRDVLFSLPNLKDNIGEIQQGLVNHAVEQSKEFGVVNPSKLEKYLLKAEKNGVLPTEDILKLKEYSDLQTMIQGNSRNATPEQIERLNKLIGEERFTQFRQAEKELSDVDLALRQVGEGKTIDEMRTQADLVVDNLIKMKSATGFENVWNKLTPAQQKSAQQIAIFNAFGEAFSYEGKTNLAKIKTYLENIGVGGGNKKEIAKKLFDDDTRGVLEDLFSELSAIQDFQKAPDKKVTQILHTLLGLGYVKTGQAPTAIYHIGSAFRLRGAKAPEVKAKELVDRLMGNTPEDVVARELTKESFEKIESGALNEIGKIFEKLLILQQSNNE